jgi:prolyl oligopeptidase
MADYGSVDVESEFRALYAYSPYHRLREGVNYPSTMVMTADHDDRVVPAHSFKFAAQLQYVQRPTSDVQNTTSGVQRPMLLRVQVRSGHGAANKAKQIENTADKYVFTWHEMGVTPSY